MTQSSCKRDTKSKSHPSVKLAPVRVFSCKHPLRLKKKKTLKDQLFKTSGLQFDNWLFRPKKFPGLSRNRPQAAILERQWWPNIISPAPFVQTVDSPIHLIHHYPLDSPKGFSGFSGLRFNCWNNSYLKIVIFNSEEFQIHYPEIVLYRPDLPVLLASVLSVSCFRVQDEGCVLYNYHTKGILPTRNQIRSSKPCTVACRYKKYTVLKTKQTGNCLCRNTRVPCTKSKKNFSIYLINKLSYAYI